MKVNKKINIVLLVFFAFNFFGNAQSSLKKLREPSSDSFYSYKMYQNYWEDKAIDRSKFPLSGIEKQIKTHGKVIVYDASFKKVVASSNLKDGISILDNTVVIKSNNSVHQIPLTYTDGLPSTAIEFSPSEINIIKDYVAKSIEESGITPSNIEIHLKKADFDLTINRSSFKNNKKIIKGHDIKSRAKQIDIANQVDNADLDLAKSNINRFKTDYPDKDISVLEEKHSTLLRIKELNSKSNTNYYIQYIEENPDEVTFSVYDGANPRKNYPIEKKDNFIDDFTNNSSPNSSFQFLKIKGLSENKADALFTSVSNKIRSRKLNVDVKKYPKYNEDVFFDGTLESIVDPNYTITDDYSGFNSYSVKVGNESKIVKLDIEVKRKIIKEKTRKIIKLFFKFFDKKAKKRAGFLESFLGSKKRIMEKYNIGSDDFENIITNQLGQKDIVIIDHINLLIQDSKELRIALNVISRND